MRLPNLRRQQHCQWRDWLYCRILWSRMSLWSLWIKGNNAWCCTVYSPLKLQPAIYGVPNDLDPSDAQSYCKASPAWKINCSLTTGFWALCTIPEDLWFTVLCIWASQEGQSGEIDFVPPAKMNGDTLHGTSQCAAGTPGTRGGSVKLAKWHWIQVCGWFWKVFW